MSLNATGNVNPGRLDRRITLQSASAERNSVGDAVVTWVNVATVWAAKTTNTGGRMFAAESKNYEAQLTYRVRYRSDIAAGWRVVHGDDEFEVTAVSEQGRGHYLDLELRAVNQTVGAHPSASVDSLILEGTTADFLLLEDSELLLLEAA